MSRRGERRTRKQRWKLIEEEFGEPARDVISGMRQQGCSWNTIAGVFEICVDTLREWRNELGVCPMNNVDRIYDVVPNRVSHRDDLARKHGYASFEELYRDMRLSKNATVEEIANMLGVHRTAVSKWTPTNLKGMLVVTDKLRDSARNNLKKARASVGASDKWRNDADNIFRDYR